MSKKKEPNQSVDEDNLTPWQKANRKYLAENGKADDNKKTAVPIDDSQNDANESEALAEDNEEIQKNSTNENEESTEEIEQPKISGPYNGSFLNRLPNLKNQRNKVLYRRLSLIIAILGIPLIFLIYYVSPYSRLQSISVSGNEVISSQTAIADTKLMIGGNVWKQYWQKENYIKELKKEQPRIETVQLHFKSVNTFQLKIKEYKETALVMKNEQYFPVIENGTILDEKVANPTKNLPILEGFTDNDKIASLVKEYNKLSSELQKAISEIKYTPRNSNKNLIQLNMNDGNQVIVNIQNLASQMNYYSKVAKDMTDKGVIDMEVGIFTYPYTKKGEETEQSSGMNETANPVEQPGQSADISDNGSETSVSNESGNTSEASQFDDNSSSSSSISTEN